MGENSSDFQMRRQPPGRGDERQQLGDAARARHLDSHEDALRDDAEETRDDDLEARERADERIERADFGNEP